MPLYAAAADLVWDNGAGNNDWNTAQNWNPDQAPQQGDIMHVYSGTPNSNIAVLVYKNGEVYLDGSMVHMTTWGISVGDTWGSGGAGSLYVRNGATLTTDTRWSGSLSVGRGLLQIESGGVVTGGGSLSIGELGTGECRVIGNGSILNAGYTRIGDFDGTGKLGIEAGGQVISIDGHIAGYDGSAGEVTVTGAGSKWTIQNGLDVGSVGSGKLTVSNGGLVSAAYTGSSVSNLYGDGTIILHNGANLDTDMVFDRSHEQMTATFGTNGTLKIAFDGSGTKNFGCHGSGSFTIADGKSVSVYSTVLSSGIGSSSWGKVTGWGSALTCDMLDVGSSGSSVLTVESGAQLVSSWCFIGLNSGSSGEVTVSGNGSAWTNSGKIVVGGGLQGLPDEPFTPATGKLTVDNGGLVTTGSIYASLTDLHGNGTIVATKGAVLDADIILDRDHENRASYKFGTGGTLNVTFNGGDMGVGYLGKGTLRIADGVKISSQYCTLGSFAGSQGIAVVSGAGSEWNYESLYVSHGKLRIESGALVSGTSTGISGGSDAIVTGPGTKCVTDDIVIGGQDPLDPEPAGRLTLADGAQIITKRVTVSNAQSELRLIVSRNDMIVLGGWGVPQPFYNYQQGKVKFYADAFVAASAYTPITVSPGSTLYMTDGTYLSCGGAWDLGSRTFTVSKAITADVGQVRTLIGGQRLLVTDQATSKRVGLSLWSSAASADFKLAPVSNGELTSLTQSPDLEGVVLSGWNFDTNLSGTETLLSFDIGLGVTDPKIWHFENGVWSPFDADLMSYDSNGILSFSVTDFGDYAVTAAPEPASLTLLLLGSLAMLRRRSK